MNWYSLRVMSGKENKVKDTIFRELDFEKDLKANVEEILIPTENIVDIKNGKKTVKEKSLLPGYILVKMIMNNETKFFIESVDGVMSFVGPKGSPQPVTEVEMSRYLVSSDGDELSNEDIDDIPVTKRKIYVFIETLKTIFENIFGMPFRDKGPSDPK